MVKSYKVTLLYETEGGEDNNMIYFLDAMDEEDAKTEGVATLMKDFPEISVLIDIGIEELGEACHEDTHGDCYSDENGDEEKKDLFEEDF